MKTQDKVQNVLDPSESHCAANTSTLNFGESEKQIAAIGNSTAGSCVTEALKSEITCSRTASGNQTGAESSGGKELGAWNPPASALAVPAEWCRLTSEALQPAPKPNTCSHPQGCLSSELCLVPPCPSLSVPLARRGCSFQHVSTSLTFPPLELFSPDRDG